MKGGLADEGPLVLDDRPLDKPYGPKIELVVKHWSGKHRSVVQGINLITTLWTDGEVDIPVDYRLYDKKRDGESADYRVRLTNNKSQIKRQLADRLGHPMVR